MNLLPPAIQAALLRGQTGFPGGGGLPSPTQELSLQFSNLAQMLAGSGPGAGRSRYPSTASLTEQQQTPEALPGSVQSLLPQFLQEQSPVQGVYGVLPQSVNRLLPVYLQPRALQGTMMSPEPSLPDPRTLANQKVAELQREFDAMRERGDAGPTYEGEPTGTEGQGTVDYGEGQFHAEEPMSPEVQRLLGAIPAPGRQ